MCNLLSMFGEGGLVVCCIGTWSTVLPSMCLKGHRPRSCVQLFLESMCFHVWVCCFKKKLFSFTQHASHRNTRPTHTHTTVQNYWWFTGFFFKSYLKSPHYQGPSRWRNSSPPWRGSSLPSPCMGPTWPQADIKVCRRSTAHASRGLSSSSCWNTVRTSVEERGCLTSLPCLLRE